MITYRLSVTVTNCLVRFYIQVVVAGGMSEGNILRLIASLCNRHCSRRRRHDGCAAWFTWRGGGGGHVREVGCTSVGLARGTDHQDGRAQWYPSPRTHRPPADLRPTSEPTPLTTPWPPRLVLRRTP